MDHQCGTCCFGSNPKTSVLDLNCLTHDLITFMPSMVAGQSHFRSSTS
ncbi:MULTISPECIES: GMC oxidoreductase [unclassified Microcoleus]